MTPATQQWPPWPIEVGRVMATATLELGVQGFEHGDDISIDGGDYGRGCRVFKLTSKDHPEYPKWCVSIEIPDRFVGNEEIAKTYRQKMLDFVRDVVHRPGWSNAMRMATCEGGHPIYWQHVYSKSGGYAGSVLAYLVYDAAIAERDKGKERDMLGVVSGRPLLAVQVEALKARVQDCETTTAEKVLDLRHLITTMNLEIQKVRADTDRLCREADAKKFYATPAAPDPTAAWRSDSDSKDALIRDLMTFVRSNPDTRIASEYLRWGNKVDGFHDRAEKLGVKL